MVHGARLTRWYGTELTKTLFSLFLGAADLRRIDNNIDELVRASLGLHTFLNTTDYVASSLTYAAGTYICEHSCGNVVLY